MTKKLWFLVGFFCLLTAPILLAAALKAKADIFSAKGEQVGTAIFTQKSNGVQLELKATNLPPGVHGFHIHNVGTCDAPDFKTAGPHFNPEGKQHGWDNPQGHHLGDMHNITVAASGKATVKAFIAGATLGDGPNSLFHPGGTALVIHEKPDDNKSDPAGNAGARIACGVITK
jgi:Cu-Zn family superoxide dismutase